MQWQFGLPKTKTFAERMRLIQLAQIKQKENDELFHKLQSSLARQEVILAKLKENEVVIKRGEKELEELIAANFGKVSKLVNQSTDDSRKRVNYMNEGNKRIRNMLTNYDYSDVSHFYEDLQGFLADFSAYMEGRLQ